MLSLPGSIRGKTRIGRLLLKTLAPSFGGEIVDKFGLCYQVPSFFEPIAYGLFNEGIYEPLTIETIVQHLPENGVFVDVGANIGSISLPVAARRPDVTVISVEADSNIFEYLQKNIASNNLPNVKAHRVLLGGSYQRSVYFYKAPPEKFGMGSIGRQFFSEPVRLSQFTLSQLLQKEGLPYPDVVKIDVEGAEYDVILGARSLCEARPPSVFIIEFMDWAETRVPGRSAGDAQELLMGLGYKVSRLESPERTLSTPLRVGGAMLLATRI